MPKIKLSEIKLDQKRFRDEIGNIDELAESIKEFGLLQPIILDQENRIVAGFRRLTATAKLGLKTIRYERQKDLTPLSRRRIELEENIQRLQMSWVEKVNGTAEIERLRRLEDPEWTSKKTAEVTNQSRATVSRSIQLAEALKEDPSLAKETTLIGALKKLKHKKALKERKENIRRQEIGLSPSIRAEVQPGDCRNLLKELPDNCINTVITSPPFGIDLILGPKRKKIYDDSEDEIASLMQEVLPQIYRVLKQDSWAVMFFDINSISATRAAFRLQELLQTYVLNASSIRSRIGKKALEAIERELQLSVGLKGWLREAGFSYVSPLPCVWVKPNKTLGMLGDHTKAMISSYESFVFAAKGNAKLLKAGHQNIFIHDTPSQSEREHNLQMPISLSEEILSLTTLGGELVLDPFAGSASVGMACLNRQVNFLGFEVDPKVAEIGNLLLKEHHYARQGKEGGAKGK